VSFVDKSLTCVDCGAPFTFTAGEQEFHAQKGFTNEPRRCPTCRSNRRSQRDGYSSGGGGSYGGSREMFSATCASCGKEARVPFQPRGDKPVYCSDCFRSQSGAGSYGGGSRRDDRW
jgi:CxxC-x17-CxxC domain-containing protein